MKKQIIKQDNYNRKPSIKFVRKAGMFCKTSFKDGKQTIEWFNEKPK